jgi:hypothetical protein
MVFVGLGHYLESRRDRTEHDYLYKILQPFSDRDPERLPLLPPLLRSAASAA